MEILRLVKLIFTCGYIYSRIKKEKDTNDTLESVLIYGKIWS